MIKGSVAIVPVVLHWDHVLPEYKSMYDNVGVPIIDKEFVVEMISELLALFLPEGYAVAL
jgi:hypothetical protein